MEWEAEPALLPEDAIVNTGLSLATRRVLLALLRGQPLNYHCTTQSDYGGLQSTIMALRRRGLLDHQQKLTGIGLEAAREIQEGKR